MALYEFQCPACGVFEKRSEFGVTSAVCQCGATAEKIMSVVARPVIKEKKRLPLGTGAPGKFVKGENGGRDILVLSMGAMEQDEVDYTMQGAIEQEAAKVKNREPTVQKQTVGAVLNEMRKAPAGERAKTAKTMAEELKG